MTVVNFLEGAISTPRLLSARHQVPCKRTINSKCHEKDVEVCVLGCECSVAHGLARSGRSIGLPGWVRLIAGAPNLAMP